MISHATLNHVGDLTQIESEYHDSPIHFPILALYAKDRVGLFTLFDAVVKDQLLAWESWAYVVTSGESPASNFQLWSRGVSGL